MTDTPSKPAKENAAARQDRLRQALRENLKRRKVQMRGRASQAGDSVAAEASSEADKIPDLCSRPINPDRD
jgi:hypothetical protein